MTQAEQRIQAARATKATSLDLSGCNLRSLPDLSGLESLILLDFSVNEVQDISPLQALSNLEDLDFEGNQVQDISPLKALSNLQSLYFENNQVQDISPLQALSNLRELYFSNNQVQDISPLQALSNLQKLAFSDNQVQDISPLKALRNLQSLNFDNNQVQDTSPLQDLSDLRELSFGNNQVQDISPLQHLIVKKQLLVKWEEWDGKTGIYLEDNPLTNPPIEIVKQGNEAILAYFEKIEKEKEYLYEAKMLIVGEGGAGKTTLRNLIARVEENVLLKTVHYIRRLLNTPKQEEKECSTRGIDVVQHRFAHEKSENPFVANIWDFGGQQIYHATHRFFLSERALYVVVMDLRRDSDGFEYWLESVEKFGKDSPVLILLNQKADREHFQIDEGNVKKRFKHVRKIASFNLRSEKEEDKNALALFVQDIQFEMQRLPLVGSVVPKSWKEIRQQIATLAQSKPIISHWEYQQICEQCGEKEESSMLILSRYFHDLGIFLHFYEHDILKNWVILQNTWATDAVYKLVDDKEILRNKGRFTRQMAENAWHESLYKNKCGELLALMIKFELCYEIPHKAQHYIMPQLLQEQSPDKLVWQDSTDDLVIFYSYDFMPKGLITHIIVRLNAYIEDHDMVWQKGTVFSMQDARTKVSALFGQKVIEVRAQGRNRKELATLICNDIDKLNDTFHDLGEKKQVPCKCAKCRDSEKPYMFTYQLLYANHKRGNAKITCEKEGEAEVKTMLYGTFTPEPIQGMRYTLSKGKLAEVLERLAYITGNAREVVLLQAQYSHTEEKKRLMSQEDYTVSINQLSADVLSVINRLDEEDAWQWTMRADKYGRDGDDFRHEIRGEFVRIHAKLADIHADTNEIKISLQAHQSRLLEELKNIESGIRYEQPLWEQRLSQINEKQTAAIERIISDIDYLKEEEGKKGIAKLHEALEANMAKMQGISQATKTILDTLQQRNYGMDTQLKLKIPLIPESELLPFMPSLAIEHSVMVDSGELLTKWWASLKKKIFG